MRCSAALLIGVLACEPPSAPTPDPVESLPEEQASAPVIDDEPNDTQYQASDLGEGGRGSLTVGDVDYFRTRGTPPLWRLDALASERMGLRVDVVYRNTDLEPATGSRGVVYAGRTTPDTLVVVRPVGDQAVAYALELGPLDDSLLGEVVAEPNSPAHPARLSQVPGRMTGFYDGPDDVDAIVIDADALAERPFAVEVSPVPGVRPRLTVRSGGGEVVALVARRAGDGVGLPNLGAAGGESLVLELTTESGEAGSAHPYTVSVHAPPPTELELVDVEPNERVALASRLPMDIEVTGFFHRPEDADLYRLEVDEPGAVYLRVTPDSRTDIQVRWRAEEDQPVEMNAHAAGGAEWSCGLRAEGGSHVLEVAPVSIAAASEAQSAELVRYTMRAHLEPDPFEVEPNQTYPGDLVAISGEIRGFIARESDVDAFWSHAQIRPIDEVGVQVSVEPPPGVDVALELRDRQGGLIVVSDAGGAGVRETAEDDLADRYIVIVRGVEGSSCEAAYTLRVR